MKRFVFAAAAAVGAFTLTACSQASEKTDADIAAEESAAATPNEGGMAATTGATLPEATGTPSTPATNGGKVLALEGLGDLVVGRPVPAGSSFAERGAQIGDQCRTISSPDYPGVYAITEGKGGAVKRITVGTNSDVKLVEGVGVGATEKDVLAAFPSFRSSPHKYVAAPGKYLTQPGNDPRLRFEIDDKGRVSLIHVGMNPELSYVEGCA